MRRLHFHACRRFQALNLKHVTKQRVVCLGQGKTRTKHRAVVNQLDTKPSTGNCFYDHGEWAG